MNALRSFLLWLLFQNIDLIQCIYIFYIDFFILDYTSQKNVIVCLLNEQHYRAQGVS